MASGGSSDPASAPASTPILSANPNALVQAPSETYQFGTSATPTLPRPAPPAVKNNTHRSSQKAPSVLDALPPKSGPNSFSNPTVEANFMTANDFTRNFIDDPLILIFQCNHRKYRLHKSLLTSKSPYFASKYSDGTQEALVGAFVLRWDEPWEIAFRSVVQFLYTGDYNVDGMDVPHTLGKHFIGLDPHNTAGRYDADANHIHVYLLADRLEISELKVRALAKYKAPFSHFHFQTKAFSSHIETLASLLYDDASGPTDILGEGGVTGQKEPKKEATKNSVSPGSAKSAHEKSAAVIASEGCVSPDLSKWKLAESAAAEASSTIEDSRRSMQVAFASRIAADAHNTGVSEVCNRLMKKGGQFAQDLFQFMRTAKM